MSTGFDLDAAFTEIFGTKAPSVEHNSESKNCKTIFNGSDGSHVPSSNANDVIRDEIKDAIEKYRSGNFHDAYEIFKRLEDQGDKEVLYYLGLMYDEGNFIDKDVFEAKRYFKKSAEMNFGPAWRSLGNYCRDNELAEKFYPFMNPFSDYHKNACGQLKELYSEINEIYGKAISLGNEDALFEQACLCDKIIDYITMCPIDAESKDFHNEVAHSEKKFLYDSVMSGDMRAVMSMCVEPNIKLRSSWKNCLYDFRCIDLDGVLTHAEKTHYVKKGAELGIDACLAQLGLMYAYGWGVDANLERAIDCIMQSKIYLPLEKVGLMYFSRGEYEKAAFCFEKIENGFGYCVQDGIMAFAEMCVKGLGVTIDHKHAFNLYRKIWIERTNGGAISAKNKGLIGMRMGEMYQFGKGTDVDYKLALECYLWAYDGCGQWGGDTIQTEELLRKIQGLKGKSHNS